MDPLHEIRELRFGPPLEEKAVDLLLLHTDMAIGSIGRWIGNSISPPQKATSRSKGGRLLYYEAVEIGETLQHVVQVGDIVEIAQKTHRRSARVNDRIQVDQPFLAQVCDSRTTRPLSFIL